MNQPSHTPDPAPARRRRQALIWIIGMVVTCVMVGLGLWQMQTFRDQGQDAMRARMSQAAVPLSSVARVGEMPRDGYGRPVVAEGSFLPERQLLIPEPGRAGRFRVLTGLRLSDGTVLPVVRGVSGAAEVPPAPTGRVQQIGLFLPTEGEPEQELPVGQLGSVRLPRLAQSWPEPLMPGFLSLDANGAAAQGMVAAEVAVPSSAGQARNSGYALQWWIFAGAAVIATIKLSRDAARGTGMMAIGGSPQTVHNPTSPDGSPDPGNQDRSPGTDPVRQPELPRENHSD